ncbi:MAG: RcnB family protein [Sphingomicrobium sp.]
MMILFLLASATPVLAAPDDADNDRPMRPSRSEFRTQRPEQGVSPAPRFGRGDSRTAPVERPPALERPQWSGADGPRSGGDRPQWRRNDGGGQAAPLQPSQEVRDERRVRRDNQTLTAQSRTGDEDSVRSWRPPEQRGSSSRGSIADRWIHAPPTAEGDDGKLRGSLDRRFGRRDSRRADAQPNDGVWDEHARDRLAVSTVPRPGTQPPLRTLTGETHRDDHRWSPNWRTDHRFDWRSERDRHRSIFHIGFYYDPFGWNYQRYQPGWRMWSSYYSRSFWLRDPSMYRLPPAYPGTQWIRYHDDALLVDLWNGEVIDVIYDFFW